MNFNFKKVLLSCAIAASALAVGIGSSNVRAETGDSVTGGEPGQGIAKPTVSVEANGSGFEVSGIDHIDTFQDTTHYVDLSNSTLQLKINSVEANPNSYKIDITSNLHWESGEFSGDLQERKYGGIFWIPAHQVTLDVSKSFKAGDSVLVTHTDNQGNVLGTTVTTVDANGKITFTNNNGYSTFSVSPAPAPAPAESSSTSVSYDKRDKNQDGVVSCDEVYGEGWTWDESQKACVLSPAASASSLPAASRNAVPKTGAKG